MDLIFGWGCINTGWINTGRINTQVDPNGHDPNKKIDRGPTVFTKNGISWPRKGGILNIGKWGQILLAENIPKFEQTGATAPYPSQIYSIS